MKKALSFILLVINTPCHSALHDRGSGLIYDDVLDISWLQDTNYAQTTGHIDSLYIYDQGIMYWDDASAWVNNLEYYDATRDITWDDWRLPRILPINGSSYQDKFNYDGTSDWGYNNTSVQSELAYMNYINLSDTPGYDSDGNWDSSKQDIEDPGLFLNLSKQYYWSENGAIDPNTYRVFTFGLGSQARSSSLNNRGVAWAVRDGDVGLVPIPAALWLFTTGLLALIVMARAQQRSGVGKFESTS